MATEADTSDPTSLMKRETEDKEPTGELINISVNKVPPEAKKKIESWLSQPLDTIKILERTEIMHVEEDNIEVASVNATNEDNLGITEGEIHTKSPRLADEVKSIEENQLNTKELGSWLEENRGMVKDQKTAGEATYSQNTGLIIQTPDLMEDLGMDFEKLTGLSNKEKRMENASSKDTEDEKNEGKEIPGDDVRDHCILRETVCPENQKTEEATESSDAAMERLSSSLIPAPVEETSSAKVTPDVDVNLKENSSMECKEGRQETVKLRTKLKDATSTEVPKENIESFYVEKVEHMCFEKIGKSEIPHEESETGLNDVIKDDQDGAHNQNTILENIAKADSSQSMTGKDGENLQPEADIAFSKPKESMGRRQSGNLPSAEVQTKECKHEEVMVVACEDDSVAAEYKTEILKYEEDSKQFIQKIEPGNATLRNPSDVAQEEIVTTSMNKHPEKIINREKQVAVHSLEEILRETTKDETNEKDIPEEKNLHPAGIDEMIRNEAADSPNKNCNDFYLTHPPVEETVQLGNENQDQVSTSELGEQVQEEFEVPKEEEKHVNDRGLDNTIPAHTCTEGAINLEPTATTCKTETELQKSGKLSTEEDLKGINPEEKSEPEEANLGSSLDVGSEKINARVQEERKGKTITDNDIMDEEISEEKNVSQSDLDDKMTSSETEIINKNDTELCVNHLVVEEKVEMPGEKNVAVFMSKFGHQVHEEFEVPKEEENQVNESSPGNINPGDRCTKGPINPEPTPACMTENKLEKCGELTTNEELKGINPEEKMEPEKDNLVSPSIAASDKINTIAVDEQTEMIANEQIPRSPKGIHDERADETIIANDIKEEISEEKSVSKSDFDERIIISETEILNQNGNELGDNHLAVEQTEEVRGQKDDALSTSELGDQVHEEFEVPKEEEKHANERGQDNTIPDNTCTEGPIHLESTPTCKIKNVFEKCGELSTEEELKGINLEEKSEPEKANQGSLSDVDSKEINIIAVNQGDGMIVKEENLIISQRIHQERMADKTIIYNEEKILKEKSVSEPYTNDMTTSSETQILSKNGADLGDSHLVVDQRVEVGSQKDDAVYRSELHERGQEEFDIPKEEDKKNNENNPNSFPAHTSTDGAINPETITTTCNTESELENNGEHSTKEESNENNPEETHKLEKENLESPSDVGSEEINTIAVHEEAKMIVEAEKPRSPEQVHEERTYETITADDIKVEEISEEKDVLAFDLDDKIKSSDIEIVNKNDTELSANHLVVEQTLEVGGQKDDVISMSELGDQAHEEFEVPKEEEKHINEKGPDNKIPERTCTEGPIDLKPTATTIKTENKLEKCDELSTEEELKEINSEKKNEPGKANLGSLSNDEEIGTIAVNEEVEMSCEEKNPIISKEVHEEGRKYKTTICHDIKEEEISEEKVQNVLESDLDDKITSSEIEIIKKSDNDLCVNNLVEEQTVEVGGQKDGVSMSELGDQVHEEYEVPKEDKKQHNQRSPDNNNLEHTCTEVVINPEPTSTTCLTENKLERCGELSTEEELKEINPNENSPPEHANQVSPSIVSSEEINTILVNEQADIIVNGQTTRSPKGLYEQRSTGETIITSDIKEENSEEKNVLESDFDDRITSSESVNLNRSDTDLWDNYLVMEQKGEMGGQKDDAVYASEVGVQTWEEFEVPTEEEEYVHERCPDNNIPEHTCTEWAISPEPNPTTCKIENELEKCGEHGTEEEFKGIDTEEISESEKANLGSPSDVGYEEISTIAVNKQAEMIVREENPRSLEAVHKERTTDETIIVNDIKEEEISEKKNVLASDLDGKITSSEIEILNKNETDLCVDDLVEEETVDMDCHMSELGNQVYNEVEVPKEEEKHFNERGLDNTIPEQTRTERATNPEQTPTRSKTENKLEICSELSTEELLKDVNPDKESEPEKANLVSPSIAGCEKINTIVVNEQAQMIVNKQTPISSKDVHEDGNSHEILIVHDIKEENSEEKMQNVLEPDFDDGITSSEPEILNWNDTDLHDNHLIVKQTVEVGGKIDDAVSRSELGDQVHEEFEVAKAEEIYVNERGPDNSIAKHTCSDGAITQELTPTTCKTENELEKSGELSMVMELKGINHEEKSEPEKANQGSSLDIGYEETNTIAVNEQAEMIVKEEKPRCPEGVHEERTTDGTMIATDIKEEEISEEKNSLESDLDDKIGCSEIEILNKNDKELCLYHLVVEETVEVLGQNDNAVSMSELGDQVHNDIKGSREEEKHVNERALDNTIPGYTHTEGTTNLGQTSSACKTESKLENYDELRIEEELKQINPEEESKPEIANQDMVSPSILRPEETNTIPAEIIVNNRIPISPNINEENSDEKNVVETVLDDRITSSEPEILKNDTDSGDNHLIVEQTVEVGGQKDDAFSTLELGDQVHREFEVNKEEEKQVDGRGPDNSIAECTCTSGAITSEPAPTTCKTENEIKKCDELSTEVELKGIDTEDKCDSEKANRGSPSDVSSKEINTVAVNDQAEMIADDIKDEGITNEKNLLASDLDSKIGSSEILILNKNDTELCLNHLVVQEPVEVLGHKDDTVSTSELGDQVHNEIEVPKESEKHANERGPDGIVPEHVCTEGPINHEQNPTTCKTENEFEKDVEVSTQVELKGINLEEKSEQEKANLGSPLDVGYEETITIAVNEQADITPKEEKLRSPQGVHQERMADVKIIANDIKEEEIPEEKMQNVLEPYLEDKIECSETEIINKNDTELCLNHMVVEETVELHNETGLPKAEEEHDSEKAPANTILEHVCTTEGATNPEQISTTCNEENKLQNSGEVSTEEELEEESKPEKVKLVNPSIVGCEEIRSIPANDQAEMMVNNQTPTSPEDVHEERSSGEMIIASNINEENSEEKNVMESDFHDSITSSEIDNHLIVEQTVEVGGQKDDAVSMSKLGDQVHEEFEAAKEEERYVNERGPDNIITEHTCTDGAITPETTPTTCKTENEIQMGGEVSTEVELKGIDLEEKSEPEKENTGIPLNVGYEEINMAAISEEAAMIVEEEKPTSPKGVHEERGTEETIIANNIKEEEISDEKNVSASYLDDKIGSSEIEIPDKNDTELCLNHLVVEDTGEALGQEDDAVSTSELGDQLHNEIEPTKVDEKHDNERGLDNTILEHGCTTEGATNPDQTSTTCNTENKLHIFGEASTEEELKEINPEEESEPEQPNLVSSSIVGCEEISTIPVNKEAEITVNDQTPISPKDGHEERSSDETIIVHDIREENSEEKNVKESDFHNTITSSETETLKRNDTVLGDNNLIVQQTVELTKLGDQVHNEIEAPMDEEKHVNERGPVSITPEHASTKGSINQKPNPITCKIEDELDCGEFSTEVELQGINLEEKCDSEKANPGNPLAVGSEDINTIAVNEQAENIVKEERPRSAYGVHEERMTDETIIPNPIKEQEISGEKMQNVLACYLDDKIRCSEIEILNKNDAELSLNHLAVEETVEVLGQEHAVSTSELGDQIHNEIELPKVEENHDNERHPDNTILEHACTIEGPTNPGQISMTHDTKNKLQNSGEVSTEEELNKIDPKEEGEPEKANLVSPSNVGCKEISTIPVNEQAEMIVNDQTPASPEDVREEICSDEMTISHDIKEENSEEKNVTGSDFDDRITSLGTEILNKNGTDLGDNHLIVEQTVEILGQKDDAVSTSELGDQVHEEFEVAKEKEKRVNEGGPDNSNPEHACTDGARTLEPAPTTSEIENELGKSGKIRTEEELVGINPEENCDSKKAYQGSHSNVCSEEINTIAVNEQAEMIVKEENPRSPHGIHEERKKDEKLIGNNIKDEEISDEKNVSASDLDDKIMSLEIEILNKNNTEPCLNHLVGQETVEVVGQKDDVVSLSELGDQVHNEIDVPKEDEKHANERGPDNTILEHACIEGLRKWKPTQTTFKTESELEKFGEISTEMELKGINPEEKSEPEKVNKGSAFDIAYEDINATAVNQQAETIVKEEKLQRPGQVNEERTTDETVIATDAKEEEISEEKNVSDSDLDGKIGSSEIEIINKNHTEICLNHLVVKETIEVLGQKDDAVPMSELGDQDQNEIQVSKEKEKHDNETASTYKTENKLSTEEVLKKINPEDKSEPEKANVVRPSIVGSEEISTIPVNEQAQMIVSEQSPIVPEGMNEERNTDETIIVSNIEKEISEEKSVLKSDFDDRITSSETEILNKNDTNSCENHLVVEQTVEAGSEKAYPVSMLELGDQVHEEFDVPKEEEKHVNERGPDNTIPEHTCTEEQINPEPAPTTCKTENELEKCGEFGTEEELKGINPEDKFEYEKANLGLPSDVGSDEINTVGVCEQAEIIVEEGKPRSPNVAHEERNTDETIIANFIKKEEISEEKNALASDLDDNITSSEIEIQNKNGIDLSFNHLVAEETGAVESQKHDAVSTSELGDQFHKESEVLKEEKKFVNTIPEHRCTVGARNPEPTAVTCRAEDKLQMSGELSTEEELNEINPEEKSEPENKTFEALGIARSSILDNTTTESAVNMEVTSTRCEMHFLLEKSLKLNSEVESKEITATDYKKDEIDQKEETETEFQITTEGNDNDKTIEEHVPAKNNAPFCTGEEECHHDQEDKNRQISLTEALPELELDSGDQSCEKPNQTNINDPIIYEEVLMDPKIADRGEGTEKEMKSEKQFVTDHSPESTSQHITKYSQENDTKNIEKKCETTSEGEGIGKQVLAEKSRVQDWSRVCTEEDMESESYKEVAMMTKMYKTEVLEILQTDEGQANVGKQTKEEDGKAADNFTQSGREETEDKCLYDMEKEGQEPHTVEEEGCQTTEVSTTMEGSATADLPSTSISEESLNEDKRGAIKLEKEVWNSNIKCIEQDFVTCSTEEKGDKAPEEKAGLNEEEETADTESNLYAVENFPSVPDISEKEIEDKILQKAGSEVPVTSKKISLTEADAEYIIEIDSSRLFSEKLSTTEPSELKANGIDLTAKPAESSAYSKNKDLDVPAAREHGTEGRNTVPKCDNQIETIIVNLGDLSKQNIRGSSTLSLEEKNLVTPVAREASEAPDKVKTLYVKAEIPLAAKTTEKDQSTNPENDTIIESVTIEKENADSQDEDQELYSSLELSSEESKPGSDVELLKRMNTCEVGSYSEVGKLECSEDEKSLDTGLTKNKSKYEMAVNECYKDVGASGECIDIKKDIQEQEDSTKSSEGGPKERVEIEKADVRYDIEDHSHGFESSEIQSSSSGKEQMTKENERAAEGEIIKEVIIKDKSCTKELHIIPITEEAINEVTGQNLAPIQSIGVAASDHIERVESKFPEDLQQESEESGISKTQDKVIKEVIKKPADTSSLVSEVSEEKIKEEGIKAAENGDNEIDIAPGMITEATGLAEVQLNDTLVKVLDSTSESKSLQTSKTADTNQQDAEVDSMKVEETSNMASQLPGHEYERTDHESMNLAKADTSNIEIKETKLPETVSTSRDHSVNEIHGRDLSLNLGERDNNQTEKQIREIPEASSSEPINQGVEADSSHEIIAPVVATEVTSFEEVQINEESIKALDIAPDAKHGETIKTANTVEQDAEVNRMKLEETSKVACQLPTHEHKKAENENITEENLEANDIEVEETKTPDGVSESNDQGVKEIPKTGTSLDVEESNTNSIDKQVGEIPKPLAELINQDREESRDDETSLVTIAQVEKNEEQHQVLSSALLSISQGIETTTTIERMPNVSPEYDDTEVDNLKLVAVSSVVSQLPATECKLATNENIEKSDADDADIIETKPLDVAPGSKDQIIEEIHETKTSRSTEIIDTDKREAEIKVVTEVVSDLRNLGADIVADSDILDHPPPPGTLGEQLQVLPYALSFNRQDCEASTTIKKIEDKSTEEDETQVEKTKLEDAAKAMLYAFSTIEQKNTDNRIAIIAKSDAAQVKVEEAKISEIISDSEIHGVQEIPSMGRTHSDKVEVHIKAVPETIYDLNYQGDEAESFRDVTVNQIAIQRKEQSLISLSPSFKELNCQTTQSQVTSDEATKIDKTQLGQNKHGSPTGTTEKPHLQDEGPRELELSSLQVKLHESQNKLSEEDSMVLEEASKLKPQEHIPGINYADSPREYKKTAVDWSSPYTSKYEGIADSGNSNEETNTLTPCSTLRDLLQGELGAKCEEASNLKFDKFREVLETMSESQSLEVFPISMETESITGKSMRDGKNHSDRTTKAEEAIKKDTLKEKEKQVTVNSHLVSPHEERVTESTQEVEHRAEDYRADKANTTLEVSRNEVQHDLVYEESVEAGADKKTKRIITAQDRTFEDLYAGHVVEGTAIVSHQEEAKNGKVAQKVCIRLDPEDKGDETKFKDTEKETTAPIGEFNRSKEILISFEENRAADSVKTMVSSKNEQQQSAELAVPPVRDAETEEAPEQDTVADTTAKEAPQEKLGKNFEEVSKPSVKRPTHGIIAIDEEDKEISTDHTINVVSHTGNEKINLTSLEPEPEGCVVAEDMSLKEQEVRTNTLSISSCPVTLEEILAEKESKRPVDEKEHDVLYDRRAEAGSILTGMGSIQFEGYRNDEDPVELSMKGNKRILDETKTHSVTTATGDEETQHQDGRPNVLSHMKDSEMQADERELMGNKEELQTEKSEKVQVEQAKTDEEKDEEKEGGECKRPGLDSDAPIMVEAIRDTDVKTAHKKSHKILSGVGSKVKHSLAKVKKAITGKPSHQKPPSPK